MQNIKHVNSSGQVVNIPNKSIMRFFLVYMYFKSNTAKLKFQLKKCNIF